MATVTRRASRHGEEPDGGHQGFASRVASAFGDSFAIIACDRVIQIVFTAILARLLTPAEFGVSAAGLVLVAFAGLFSQLGLGGALIQKPDLNPRTLATAQAIAIASAVLVMLALWFLAPLAAEWFRKPQTRDVVRALSVLCFLQALMIGPNALLTRRLSARLLGLIDLVAGAAGTALVAIPMALAGFSYWSIVGGIVGQVTVKVVLLWVAMAPSRFVAFDLGDARQLLVRGGGFLLTNLLQRISLEGDRLIVGRYLSAAHLGLYSRASSLASFSPRFYGAVLDRVAFPAFAHLQRHPERLRKAYLHGVSLTALLGWPAMVFLFATSPDVVLVALGASWVGAILPLQILCGTLYFELSSRLNGALLRGSGRPYRMAGVQGLAAAMTVLGCLWGSRYGLAGIATAVLCVSVLNDLILTVLAARLAAVSLPHFLGSQASGAALALLVALIVVPLVWVAHQLELAPILTLALATGLTGGAVLAAIRMAPRIFLGPAGETLLGLALARLPMQPRPSASV